MHKDLNQAYSQAEQVRVLSQVGGCPVLQAQDQDFELGQRVLSYLGIQRVFSEYFILAIVIGQDLSQGKGHVP